MTGQERYVATLSPAAEVVARAAPALVGSHVLPLDQVRNLPSIGAHLVIAGLWDDLQAADLEYGYAAQLADGPTISFALGGTSEELMDVLGACNEKQESDYSGQTAILNNLDLAESRGEGWTILGRLASPESVLEALSKKPVSLLISTHGDGLDVRLPADLHLCSAPWEDLGESQALPNTPFCAGTRECYWINAAFESEGCRHHLVTSQQISARTIILDSCLAMQSGEGLFPGRSLLLRKLAARADCEEIVCFSGYQVEDGQRLLDMSYELTRGVPACELVQQYNRAASSRALGRRAYLLHGRRWRAASTPTANSALPMIRERERPAVHIPETNVSRAERWTRLLSGLSADVKEERIAVSLRTLLDPLVSRNSRTALLADLLCGIDTIALWSSRLGTDVVSDYMSCPVCGTTLAAAAGKDHGIKRIFAQCHACNYYSDADDIFRGDSELSNTGELIIRNLRPGSEIRIRTAPAGCPKYPVRIMRIADTTCVPAFDSPIKRSTALSFRAKSATSFRVQLARLFDRPPLFIAVVIVDEDGYSSQTFTTHTRAQFLRNVVPSMAEEVTLA